MSQTNRPKVKNKIKLNVWGLNIFFADLSYFMTLEQLNLEKGWLGVISGLVCLLYILFLYSNGFLLDWADFCMLEEGELLCMMGQ